MSFYFPDHRALCAAETTSHTLHNILTLRGALVRDAHEWARYLTETIGLWGDDLEVVFASHHWPTWGRERTHGYYGSVSHNVKAIYQRLLGWYEGNPARLWRHPPEAAAERYVAAMGGPDAAVAVARKAYDEGDHRWAVEVLDHVLFADDSHAAARALQADAMEQLAFGAENGTWRNAYLAGATELRDGRFGTPAASASPDLTAALSATQVFDRIAIRIDGPRAWDHHLTLSWVVTDEGATYVTELRNGVLNHRRADAPAPGTHLTLSRPALIGLVTGTLDAAQAAADGTLTIDGDPGDIQLLVSLLAPVDPDFAIVTP
jgi:alkyl sulfatase BDS1-like metallo-beta-lactamase superfamily hydrolase